MGLKKQTKLIEAKIGGLFLAIMLLLLAYQVVLRWLGSSNSWSEEIARYMFIWVVYIGGSLAAAEGAHITITTALLVWPKKIRPYIEMIGTLAWIGISALISYYAIDFAVRLYLNKTISLGLQINMFWPYLGLVLGYVFMTLRIVQYQLMPQIKNILRKEEDSSLTEVV